MTNQGPTPASQEPTPASQGPTPASQGPAPSSQGPAPASQAAKKSRGQSPSAGQRRPKSVKKGLKRFRRTRQSAGQRGSISAGQAVTKSVDPDSGPAGGGTPVTIQVENNLVLVEWVRFGAVAVDAKDVEEISPILLKVKAPPGIRGDTVEITVKTQHNEPVAVGTFTYT